MALRKEVSAEKEALVRTSHKKTSLLMEVHRRKELYLALVKSRDESHETLIKEVIIDRKPAAKEAPKKAEPEKPQAVVRKFPDFKKLQGKVPRPVPGRIVRNFGRDQGQFGAVVTRHGIVFSATPGIPVRAVASGRVIHVGWLQGYGNIIIVNHGRRYYTLTGGLYGLTRKAWTTGLTRAKYRWIDTKSLASRRQKRNIL